MNTLLVATFAIAALSSCGGPAKPTKEVTAAPNAPGSGDLEAKLREYEERSAAADAERRCERPVPVYSGSIRVSASNYPEPVEGLDRILTKSTRVRFVLDYPFERPFEGVVTGDITLRRTIDAIRAGFRQMYEGSIERDIPNMHNKEVTGPNGRAFHVADDLVIESIDLCADDTFSIFIGS